MMGRGCAGPPETTPDFHHTIRHALLLALHEQGALSRTQLFYAEKLLTEQYKRPEK